MFDYNGKQVEQDPWIAIGHGEFDEKSQTFVRVERRERTEEWFYEGHPCQAYLDNTDEDGVKCSARPEYDMSCAACRAKRRALKLESLDPDWD